MRSGARQELVAAVEERYRQSTSAEERWILDEFVALTGYHGKTCRPDPQRHRSEPTGAARVPVRVIRDRDRRVDRVASIPLFGVNYSGRSCCLI